MVNRLRITVGLPRSGKTTWAKERGFPIVNPDSIRAVLFVEDQAAYWAQPKDIISSCESEIWGFTHNMIHALFMAGNEDVILDATSINISSRTAMKNIPLWHRTYVEFRTPMDVCIERAKLTNREDMIPIIEKMAEMLTWPNEDEYDAISVMSEHKDDR